ncbi:MAG: Peptidyl-tRNA hydrolase [Parcubacteria group bacterium GW2011_GWF2_38_76]|nr:MAG: Peptidyl-tRNA hydrolase [Parcubacteria group bacterium GW2011_GWF2_38_76]HBM45613.1 aminoacyl-tRNA hydrolase [Patescibacteria group bacterium]
MSYIIVGLGNPGEEYEDTRHNMGRIVLENMRKIFSKDADFSDWEFDKKLRALFSEGKVAKQKIMLIEPDNYMNNSGGSVKPLITSKKKAEELIVIHDDLDLPIGKYKITFNRGSGGHKGVESIIKNIKTEGFVRFRMGISPVTPSGKLKKPSGEEAVTKMIMGKFKESEMAEIKKMSKRLAEATEMMIAEGRDKAMSLFSC